MKITYSLCLLPLLIITCAGNLCAQDYASQKEKIYLQTNHSFFSPGDAIYFKLYVVRAEDNKPTNISSVVYTELISPSGTLLQKAKYPVTDGYAEGSFDFNSDAPGGIYKLRAYTSWMQNENESLFFVKEITLQKVLAPRILMKLDFPEKGYGPGAAVKADFSMRSLEDQPIRHYEGKYTVFIGGAAISQTAFKTDGEGKATIWFTLPGNLSVNDGILTITVQYDSYTESVSRSIPIVLNKIDLQFMPEGGTLVDGLSSWVAFKALNEFGKATDIKGELRDQQGNTITHFDSYHFGMGKFEFTPKPGQSYNAYITSPAGISQSFEFPKATANGVVMHIEKDRSKILVRLRVNGKTDVKLRGISRNTTYYTRTLTLQEGENTISINENDFPAGIAQFTLYAANELPLAERLVFLNESRQLNVSVKFDKTKYMPREKVMMSIKTMDENGTAVPSNFSISVADDKLWTYADDKQDHILSWLLVSSELKGKIEEPRFYFKKDETKAIPALDLLMLTHGYRYFDFIDYVVKEGALKHLPDQSNILSGVVQDLSGNPVQARLFILQNTGGGMGMELTTGNDGTFFFSDLLSNSQYVLFAQSLNKKGRVVIHILQNGIGYNPATARSFSLLAGKPLNFEGIPASPVLNAIRQKQNPALFKRTPDEEIIGGTEVVVTSAYGMKRRRDITGSVAYVRADELLDANRLGNVLQGRVAGLHVMNKSNYLDGSQIRIRGMAAIYGENEPLYIINGVPVSKLFLNTMNQNDIESITVLKDGNATALYGSAAAYGAIIIESKTYRRQRIQLKFGNRYYYSSQLVNTSGANYTPVRKFYAPKYERTETDERTDFRETIYWNPVVQTNKEGIASVEFYNSDASSTFRAVAEGLGYNGMIGRTEHTYVVQQALQLDAKIPPYLTVGDKALLPLVIRNNSTEAGTYQLNITPPEKFILGPYSNTVSLQPDSSIQLLIPLETGTATSGIIRFSVTGPSSKEVLSLPVAATDNGFPVKMVFSGNQDKQHQFTIANMVPGTLRTNLRLFKSLEGQLVNGIESMLREPHGCFEQTSSSTYPNIYILKYLKEHGKSNPEIEKTALEYIRQGYKKLIGFETSQNGFEWFGNTPPHEALTAYGLLEFTDMKEFVEVDEKMLERTKKFLMSRRDKEGGFRIQNKGYDQFASVPNKIAHLYIVYALTQAGIGKEIEPEYKSAVKKAFESKDAYQLALMALAASNMKDQANYLALMQTLNQLPEKLNAETSVVNSRDASLRVESWSLHTLALLRSANPDLAKAAGLLSNILAEKNYYGYGSTQSTVLALKALTEYARVSGKVSENATVHFKVNDTVLTDYAGVNPLLQTDTNVFAVTYEKKEGAVPYNLELSYNTYLPPTNPDAELKLKTTLKSSETTVGETVRMDIEIINTKSVLQPMAIAKIGIPAGLSIQPWQLKEFMEKNKCAYYEIFDNYLVFYWMGFAPNETKTLGLDLKAEIPGTYKAKASTVYLYYTPEYKYWAEGTEATIR